MALAKLDLRDVVVDPDGNLNAGGFVYTYAAGTTTPLVTYSDGDGTENANPTELDASGQWACYLDTSVAYKLVFADPLAVPFYTADNITVSDGVAASGSQYVDAEFIYPGGPPAISGWLGGRRFTRAVTFPANFVGSFGFTHTNPTSSFVGSIQKNGVEVGTLTVNTSGLYTFATTAGAVVNFAAGDRMDAYGPAIADATIADFGFTLAGSLQQ